MAFPTRNSLMAAFLITMSTALPLPADAMDTAQQKEFGAFIHDYLLANPEILEEMQTALEAKREAESQKMAKAAIADNKDALFHDPQDMVLGDPNGDVTVVEFFDYNCGYCKHALADITALLKDDPKIRFVLKEFPILGPDSLAAHRVAMSFRKLAPEKYADFHLKLLGGNVRATQARAIEIATGLGVDEDALKAGMSDPAIDASIKKTYKLANALGVSGTPSFVVGDEAVFGAVGEKVLLDKIKNMRKCNSTVCS